MTRYVVRVLPELFDRLAEILSAERGPHGEPTRAEFEASDLLEIVDAVAGLWDSMPPTIPGRRDYRMLLLRSRHVAFVTVYGQLSPVDGGVELHDIELDFEGLPDPDQQDQEDDQD